MFGESQAANLQTNQNSSEYYGLKNQLMHPFQPHLPTAKQEGEVLPPYQSVKKTVPTMYQDNGVELMTLNNGLNAFPNAAFDGRIPQQNQPSGYAYPQNSPHPQQYQLETTQADMDPYSMASPSGGLLYFNQTTTLSTQKVPSSIKQEGQSYTGLLVLNLVLIVAVIGSFVVVKFLSLQMWMFGAMISVPYFVYILVGLITNSALLAVFNNMKDSAQIEKSFEMVKTAQGNITFLVYCYHTATGVGHRSRRVTTHTAKSSFPLSSCVDQSEDFSALKQKYSFLIGTASTCFYFGDLQSQTKFLNAFKAFRDANRKDRFQNFTHGVSIQTPNMGQPFTICTNGSGCYVKPLYYLFFFLGFGYLYTMFIERSIGRFRLNSVKRLTAA